MICRASDGALVGVVGFRPRSDGTAETGYWIAKDHRGHGYAAEATRRLASHAFERFGYRRIVAAVKPENTASQKVIARVGFVRIGEEICQRGGIPANDYRIAELSNDIRDVKRRLADGPNAAQVERQLKTLERKLARTRLAETAGIYWLYTAIWLSPTLVASLIWVSLAP